jgi:hypothetical protein
MGKKSHPGLGGLPQVPYRGHEQGMLLFLPTLFP